MNIILSKNSKFQIKFVNEISESFHIGRVFIEEGNSSTSSDYNFIYKVKLAFLLLSENLSNPNKIFNYLLIFILYPLMYGFKGYIYKKHLKNSYDKFKESIDLCQYNKNNLEIIHNYLEKSKIDNVLVYGTSIIKPLDLKKIKEKINGKIINIHWGNSNHYRGDGIYVCLAKNDKKNLGLTLHELTDKIDYGNLISIEKIQTDKFDNFISIFCKMTLSAIIATKKILHKNYSYNSNIKAININSIYYGKKYLRDNPSVYLKAFFNLFIN